MIEIRNQHPIQLPARDPVRRRYRAREKRFSRGPIDKSDALEVHFSKCKIRQLCKLARAADRDSRTGHPFKGRQHVFETPPHIPVIRQRILHVLVGQPRLFGEPLRGQQITDTVARNARDFDLAFAGKTLQIQVGQP